RQVADVRELRGVEIGGEVLRVDGAGIALRAVLHADRQVAGDRNGQARVDAAGGDVVVAAGQLRDAHAGHVGDRRLGGDAGAVLEGRDRLAAQAFVGAAQVELDPAAGDAQTDRRDRLQALIAR